MKKKTATHQKNCTTSGLKQSKAPKVERKISLTLIDLKLIS